MRLRVLLITALLVGGFLYTTSKTDWGRHRIFQPISNVTGPIWSGPSAVRGAGLSSDEMNNIDIYIRQHDADGELEGVLGHPGQRAMDGETDHENEQTGCRRSGCSGPGKASGSHGPVRISRSPDWRRCSCSLHSQVSRSRANG